jgi:hypothetical protein
VCVNRRSAVGAVVAEAYFRVIPIAPDPGNPLQPVTGRGFSGFPPPWRSRRPIGHSRRR